MRSAGDNRDVDLPPRDPHEPAEPEGVEVGAPTVIFAAGQPSAGDARLAETILRARPGVLFVLRA
jgi:hypothetical protein